MAFTYCGSRTFHSSLLNTIHRDHARHPSLAVSCLVMKQLIRRLARVADSSTHYTPLRPDAHTTARRSEPKGPKDRLARSGSRVVPIGHVPVYVGEEMERFVVSAELLNRPVFVELLKRSAQEYGYEQKGVLKIPCRVGVFERVLEAMNGGEDDDVEEMAAASLLSDEELL